MNNAAAMNNWMPGYIVQPTEQCEENTDLLVMRLEARLNEVRRRLAQHDKLSLEEKRLLCIIAAAKVK